MTVAVDFDGTIVEHKYPEIGKEIPFAIETLRKLADSGHRIILWTVREGELLDKAVEYCRKRGLEFYAVNSEYPDSEWKRDGISRKVTADMYIDDRNLGGIPDWHLIYEMITMHMSYADLLEKLASDEDIDPVIYNGTFRSNSTRRKEGFFARLHRKCRDARSNYRI